VSSPSSSYNKRKERGSVGPALPLSGDGEGEKKKKKGVWHLCLSALFSLSSGKGGIAWCSGFLGGGEKICFLSGKRKN